MEVLKESDINYAYTLAQKYASNYQDWNWGKCIFAAYQVVSPKLVNDIKGTQDDCHDDDSKVKAFLKHFTFIEDKQAQISE